MTVEINLNVNDSIMPLSLSPKNINWDANGNFSPVETNVHFCGNLNISVAKFLAKSCLCRCFLKGSSKIFNNDNKFGYQMCPQRDSQRFLTMTINVRIMPAASEQSLFIQSGLNAAAGRKETELIYYFSPDFHSARFFTWPTFSLGPFFH